MSLDVPRLRDDLLVHAGFVRALARSALRGDPECEDLEQDVWHAALVGAPTESSRQRPWLVSVLRRRAADLLRRRARRERRELASAGDRTVPPTADSVARAEIGRRLVDAVLALDEPFRTAVLLRFQDGLAPREIAARTGVPAETARSRVRRGLERLRAALEERERRGGSSARGALMALGFDDPGRAPPSSVTSGGLVVTKKLVVGVALLLAAAGGAIFWFANARTGDDRADPSTRALARTDDRGDAMPGLAAAPAPVGPAMAVDAAPLVRATASPSATTNVVKGRLVGEDGVPIGGARVRTGEVNGPDFLGDAELLGMPDAVLSTTLVAGEDGRFEVEGLPRYGGAVQVYPHAPGWCLPSPVYMNGVTLRPGSESDVHMKRGVPFDVRVVDDATGDAIPGATVAVYRSPGYLLYNLHSDDEATTDEAGRVAITVPGGDVRVVASAGGYATREGEAQNVGVRGAEATVRLRRGGTLEVAIVDGEGRAVAGARAVVLRASAARIPAVSDARGVARFAHVPSIEPTPEGFEGRRLALIAASAEGFVRTWLAVDAPSEGETKVVRLALVRPRTLSGVVRHRDGSAAAGVLVLATTEEGRPAWGWSRSGGAGVHTKSGEDGRFELPGVTPGRVTLTVGNIPGVGRGGSVRTFDLPALGDVAPLELSAEPEGSGFGVVRVRVADSTGRGVAAARVGILAQRATDVTQFHSSLRMTAADGVVEVEPAEAGPWWLSIDAPGLGPVLRRVAADEAARGPIEVRPASGAISGRVMRLDGSPARVRLFLTCSLAFEHGSLEVDGYLGAVESAADGRFAFAGVAECVGGLRCATPGVSILADGSQPIRAGRDDLRVVVIDEAEAAGLRIEVLVLDAASRTAPGVAPEVHVSRDFAGGYAFAWPVPGSTGVFRSEGILAPGTWHVRVAATGYETQEADVTVMAGKSSPRLEVRLEKQR